VKLSINTEDKVSQPRGEASQRHMGNMPHLDAIECRRGSQEVA